MSFLSFLKEMRTHAKGSKSTQYLLQKEFGEMCNILEGIGKLQRTKSMSILFSPAPTQDFFTTGQSSFNKYLLAEPVEICT